MRIDAEVNRIYRNWRSVFAFGLPVRTIRSPEQVTAELNLPVMGLIAQTVGPHVQDDLTPRVTTAVKPIALQEPQSPATDAYRALVANLQRASVDRPLRTLLVTSPGSDEGKSTVAANLAVVLAQAGRETILLDADFRQPCIARLFDQHDFADLATVLSGDSRQWLRALMPTKIARLMTVPSMPGGHPAANPAKWPDSKRLHEFIGLLREHSETIVIDSPLLSATDALGLAPQADGVLIVVRHGATPLRAAQQTVTQLQQAGARVVGVVLNRVPASTGRLSSILTF